jgi:hypothetical protein
MGMLPGSLLLFSVISPLLLLFLCCELFHRHQFNYNSILTVALYIILHPSFITLSPSFFCGIAAVFVSERMGRRFICSLLTDGIISVCLWVATRRPR